MNVSIIAAQQDLKIIITGQYAKETCFQPPSWARRNLIASEGCDSSFGWDCDSSSSSFQGSASFLDYALRLGCNKINQISSDLPGKLKTETKILSNPLSHEQQNARKQRTESQTEVTVII